MGIIFLSTHFNKKTLLTYTPLIVIFVLLVVFWSTGLIGLWTKGLYYATDNTNWNGHKLDGEYSVTIDLSDLKSSIGKELYNDGTHKIYISHIDNTGDIKYGGYRVQFRSVGHYSLEGASLISGVHHIKLGENEFSYDMTAEMKAEYNGQTYKSSVFGFTGLSFKDGDSFSFYIFPASAFESQKVTMEESGDVHLTVTNLYKNIWNKK